jgi:hypothetical protein
MDLNPRWLKLLMLVMVMASVNIATNQTKLKLCKEIIKGLSQQYHNILSLICFIGYKEWPTKKILP